MLTYSEIAAEVTAIFRPGDTSIAARVLLAVNATMLRMARMHDFYEMLRTDSTSVDTVVGTKTITLPAAVKTVYGIGIENSTQSNWLLPYPHALMDRSRPYPESDAQGQPVYAILWGAVDVASIPCLCVELIPVPDAVYDVLIRAAWWPTDFTGSGTEYADFKNKDDIIIAGAVAELYQRFEDNFETAAKWDKRFTDLFTLAKMDDSRHVRHFEFQPFVLNPSPSGDYWKMPFVSVSL